MAIEWRGLLTVLTAVVQSTLPEARVVAVTETLALQEAGATLPVSAN